MRLVMLFLEPADGLGGGAAGGPPGGESGEDALTTRSFRLCVQLLSSVLVLLAW
jgi:hypothetical protein